jgi:DNA-binding MarR family transcriptional regulator
MDRRDDKDRRGDMDRHDEESCARAWSALSGVHALVTEQLAAALEACSGLTITEFEVLLRLGAAGAAGVRLGALCPAVRLTQPSLSRAVARLERQGRVRRAGAPGDGRGVLVSLTPAGRVVLARASAVHDRIIRGLLLDQLTPDEQDLLTRALTRVIRSAPDEPDLAKERS